MLTALLAALLGAVMAVGIDIYVFGLEPGPSLWAIARMGALKGALIGWLVPKSIEWLWVALIVGALLGGFFWAMAPVRGSYPADALAWWNFAPGVLLGMLLIIKSRSHARRVAALERTRYSA